MRIKIFSDISDKANKWIILESNGVEKELRISTDKDKVFDYLLKRIGNSYGVYMSIDTLDATPHKTFIADTFASITKRWHIFRRREIIEMVEYIKQVKQDKE